MGLYDKDIRKILLDEFIETPEFIKDPSTIIVNELDVCSGSAIMDIAVINGKIHGFEIKSEFDTLERLQTQGKYYNKVFDTVTLVVSDKHIEKAIDLIPEWWGIYSVVTNQDSIEVVRNPKLNESINVFSLSLMLWKPELICLLNEHGITKGLKSKTRRELSKITTESVNPSDIKSFVKSALKGRKPWKARLLQLLHDEKQHSLPN
ncbi:sce7726 family protein [Virgibacillus oceani]